MNLHAIVRGAITRVNPDTEAVFKVYNGAVTIPGGKREQSYTDVPVTVQLQELSSTDLRQVDAVNIQGILRVAYLNGNFSGINRPEQKGGDILMLGEQKWLVVKVVELWPDWVRVIINQQVT